MKITVLGCGRWGSFLAWYFHNIGYEVLLWGRSTSEKFKVLSTIRENAYVKLSKEVVLSNSLSSALDFSDVIVIAIKEQSLRDLMKSITTLNYCNKTFVLCMKGIENQTCKRLSEVVYEHVGELAKIAIMIGPGQPSDIIKGIPTCMLIDSIDRSVSESLAERFNSDLINIKVGNDLIGNEIGSAVNKLIGIAGGILDELGCSSLKGPLMVAGTREIAMLIESLGGKSVSAYGLCCLGDYQASLFSEHSNSVAFGRSIVKNENFQNHAPGAFTAKTVIELVKNNNIEMPILLLTSQIIMKIEDYHKIVYELKKYRW